MNAKMIGVFFFLLMMLCMAEIFTSHDSMFVWIGWCSGVSAMLCIALHYHKLSSDAALHPEASCLKASDAWSEHPQFTRQDWRDEAAANDTQLGYWPWLSQQLYNRDNFTPIK